MDEYAPYVMASPVYFLTDDERPDDSEPYRTPDTAGWLTDRQHEWTYRIPSALDIAAQGWKIHTSTTLAGAQDMLDRVSTICERTGTPYKHLSTRSRLFWRNSLSCPREHAGKFITCYPTESNLEEILRDLDDALSDFDGPYVLSDRRWKTAPVYLRYGAFTGRERADGTIETSLESPDGHVQDTRDVAFEVPTWVKPPPVIAQWLHDQETTSDAQALPFTVSAAIQFSNGGGIYRGEVADDTVFIKEGRPHAGLDDRGRDAFSRLTHEANVLRDLNDVPAVPTVRWEGPVWEHYFVALEAMDGIPLQRWMSANHPGYARTPDELDTYLTAAISILTSLTAAIEAVHAKGWTHQDIHPGNILVEDSDPAHPTVALIDFEAARRTTEPDSPQPIGAPGFRAHGIRPVTNIDWHGVQQVGSFLLMPVIQQADLVGDYASQIREFAPTMLTKRSARETRAVPTQLPRFQDLMDRIQRAAGSWATDKTDPRHADLEAAGLARYQGTVSPSSFAEAIALGLRSLDGAVPGRRFPVHIYGRQTPNNGLAFGDATITALAAPTDVTTRTSNERHQLQQACESAQLNGLFTGAVGDLLALLAIDGVDEADHVLQMRFGLWLQTTGRRLYDGLPGVVMGLARAFTTNPELATPERLTALRRSAEALLRDYDHEPGGFAPVGTERANASNHPSAQDSGLLYGHLGIAWMCLELQRCFPDLTTTRTINAALYNELDGYVYDDRYQSLQLQQGRRQLPYLSMGSAGFGIVLGNLSPTDVDHSIAERLPHLLNAVDANFSVFPGLFNGYSGLMLGKAGISRFLRQEPPSEAELIDALSLYAIASPAGVVFAGDSGLRLTADLASGSAGILTALHNLRHGIFDILPRTEFLVPAKNAESPHAEGREKHVAGNPRTPVTQG